MAKIWLMRDLKDCALMSLMSISSVVAKSKVRERRARIASRGITSTTGTEGRQRCQIDPLSRRPDINLSGENEAATVSPQTVRLALDGYGRTTCQVPRATMHSSVEAWKTSAKELGQDFVLSRLLSNLMSRRWGSAALLTMRADAGAQDFGISAVVRCARGGPVASAEDRRHARPRSDPHLE